MAIPSVQSLAPVEPIQAPQWPFDGLKGGETLAGTVAARLDGGALRLALLGQLLDLLPSALTAALQPGDAVRIKVVQGGAQPVVSLLVDGGEGLDDAAPPPASPVPGGTAQQASASSTAKPATWAAGQAAGLDTSSAAHGNDQLSSPASAALPANQRAALAAMMPAAAAIQKGLGLVLADAGAVLQSVSALPKEVQAGLQALLVTGLDPASLDASGLKEAVASSGVFREAALARSATQAGADRAAGGGVAGFGRAGLGQVPLPASDGADSIPDGALSTSEQQPASEHVAAGTAGLQRPDVKSLLLALRSAILSWPVEQGDASEPAARHAPAASQPSQPAIRAAAVLPPPTHAMTTIAQPLPEPRIDAQAPPAEIARAMLSDVDGAIGRVQLFQAAALPGAAGTAASQDSRRFDIAMDIPFRLPGQTPVLSLAIGRDEDAAARGGAAVPASRGWRMQVSLDVDPAGPLHALVRLRGRSAGVTLWAERAETRARFETALPQLCDALHAADLDVESLEVRAGAPPQPRPVSAGAMLDRRS